MNVNKILNYIYKALNFIKDSAELIKWCVIAFLAITAITGIKSCNNQKQEKNNISDILNHSIETYKTESGKHATEIKNWNLKYESLEKVNGEISKENSYLKKELIEAKQTIEDLNIKAKNVQNYIKMELVSKDSINTKIIYEDKPCRFKIEPIETEHLSVIFEQSQDYEIMGLDHEYRTDIKTLITLYKDPEQFFLWRWIKPRYKDKTVTIVEDKKATINNFVEITFN